MTDTIDYPGMIDTAMRGVVREALVHIDKFGLPGEHHFFISFQTNYPGVSISPQLKSRYPEEITIVVQHQFWDLFVGEEHFEVTLSFDKKGERLIVPFAAVSAFADPSVKFGLQFQVEEIEATDGDALRLAVEDAVADASMEDEAENDSAPNPAGGAEVITLDSFRKNQG